MSATILSGRDVRDSIIPKLFQKVQESGYTPTLAIIQIGTRSDSTAFIKAKKSFAKKIGIKEKHIELPESISEDDLILKIKECNQDEEINAIIVQLPLPAHINQGRVIQSIDSKKDADGLTQNALVIPATARGIKELLEYYHITLKEKKVTIIGRSILVGIPVAQMCREQGALVTVCHRGTGDIISETRVADIIIVAAGSPGLIMHQHVREGQIIIDVGINKLPNDQLVGDVDFDSVKDIVKAITPVPGGVGPMTVTALFENIIDLCKI